MNAKKSWVFFALGAVILAVVVWGFAHGCKIVDVNMGTGVAWIVGSLVVGALGVFLSYKLRKKE